MVEPEDWASLFCFFVKSLNSWHFADAVDFLLDRILEEGCEELENRIRLRLARVAFVCSTELITACWLLWWRLVASDACTDTWRELVSGSVMSSSLFVDERIRREEPLRMLRFWATRESSFYEREAFGG